ncbi:RNA polymerase sigma factor [Billgrantia azerbaijanica]|nr:RNA polymerase sigma factor [Halomonas azerbaijanica]
MESSVAKEVLAAGGRTGAGVPGDVQASRAFSPETLYRRYRQELLAHLQGIVRDAEIAEDLLQESFVRLLRLPDAEAVRQPRPFLYRVASNLALDHLRRCRRLPEHESEAALMELISPAPEPWDELVQERQRSALGETLGRLSPRAREALVLVRYREMTGREAAREMGISQTMVEKHLGRALRQCREMLVAGKP